MLAFHEVAGSAETALGQCEGDRPVQEKVGLPRKLHLYGAAQAGNGDHDRMFVSRCGAGARDRADGRVILTIHDDRFESAPGQGANGGIGIRAVFDTNFQLTQYPAQRARRLIV
ncbi:MAG TPA: hypothetical protein VEG68_14055 [Terriglobales bacterium]|nr:hypothetical protein [Terriglobales bacterium]